MTWTTIADVTLFNGMFVDTDSTELCVRDTSVGVFGGKLPLCASERALLVSLNPIHDKCEKVKKRFQVAHPFFFTIVWTR